MVARMGGKFFRPLESGLETDWGAGEVRVRKQRRPEQGLLFQFGQGAGQGAGAGGRQGDSGRGGT